jgi:urocanate hydratase
MVTNLNVANAMTIKLDAELPEAPEFVPGIRRAPDRGFTLNRGEAETALKNALRYIPEALHAELALEFMNELKTTGRIYGYRFRPAGDMPRIPVDQYEGNCIEGKAFQVMIDNNLHFDVALYPYELVTYGETGQVCQNWMQYQLIKKYLAALTQHQTLVIESGHPLGLFRSHPGAPRVITTNGLMIGMFDNQKDWHHAMQLGVANYGQMTAGGWMYIGPQGIVHGTFNTLLNAVRRKYNNDDAESMAGYIFVSSGLGGMSGAQPKAVEIAGGVGIIAEVDESRIDTRHEQGWVSQRSADLAEVVRIAQEFAAKKEATSIAYHGNVVDLLEYIVKEKVEIHLLSDQTSCHAPYDGGYCPQGVSFSQRTVMLKSEPVRFRELVDKSLQRHYELIKVLVERDVYFFDYGNSFMKAIYDAGVQEICLNGLNEKDGFIWPSYVEDIMGPILFDYGYGPFRWLCLSGRHEDLAKTDKAAMDCIDPNRRQQDRDNWIWIRDAEANQLVVGMPARILYQDAMGRMEIALRFNEMVRNGDVGPIMLGRDHHDTGGTDSPFRETANIKDGSNVMADMATQCFAGNAARGMSLCALHNGGGVGIGKSINGGFGLVLDGTEGKDEIIRSAIRWDVMGGVARRAWARNENSITTCIDYNGLSAEASVDEPADHITLPFIPDSDLVSKTVNEAIGD